MNARTRMILGVGAALLALSAVASAGATASGSANCLGGGESAAATTDGYAVGQGTTATAHAYRGIGQELSPAVRTDCGEKAFPADAGV